MPKKPARNAFYFYMKELEPSLRKEGRVFPNGMADVVPVAHPRWKSLPESEKDRFESMAKEYKARMRGVEGDKHKMDNIGNIISKRVNVNEVNDKRRQRERREVTAKWTGKDITEEKFYFIDFQILCKTQNGDYLPCEMAIIEYSLARGIIKKFHRFIEPGQIPTGYRYGCMNSSEETHQIPIENFEKADSNYTGICIQIENFINPNGELPEYPPFYCVFTVRDKVEYCLEWLHDRSRLGRVSRTKKVHCVEDLLMDLYVHGNGPKISQSGCLDVLTSHHWDYTSKTRCEFHEELECKFCSLAIVQRLAYAISDSLAVLYQIRLTDKHLPSTADEDIPCVTLPPTPIYPDRRYEPPRHESRSVMSHGRGQRNEASRPTPQSRVVVDDDDDDIDDEEEMKTSLRRPNVAPMGYGDGNPWHTVGKQTGNSVSGAGWPSLGSSKPGNVNPKTPSSWQNGLGPGAGVNDKIFGQSNIPLQRDMIAPGANSGQMAPRMPTSSIRAMMRPLGPQSTGIQSPGFSMRGVQMTGRMPSSLGMAGRGSNLMGGSVRPPVGRGYAPPGMLKMQNQLRNTSISDE
ncbi:hypothetical protein LOTGIDRAFT_158312 [Lottia gigantea]|uniref:HMG box domain-containing protein n=1 Tax=Lottia gigantea TaxID=225164 RepID=V4AYE1_LOTGI|nr:hypothetical protein LOTGIDRAFT_158312 [Lottia gigantea]ESP00081.1 hypothetical protein LOTGIDRAFT_158312 [Lottia gigantea]